MQPNRRSVKRLREVLNNLYAHLDSTALSGKVDVSAEGETKLGYQADEERKDGIEIQSFLNKRYVECSGL